MKLTAVLLFGSFSAFFCFAQEREHQISSEAAIDSIKWSSMGLDSLESYSSAFNYSVIDTIQFNEVTAIRIERWFLEEQIQWLCIFGNEDRLLDFIVVDYSNSDGS